MKMIKCLVETPPPTDIGLRQWEGKGGRGSNVWSEMKWKLVCGGIAASLALTMCMKFSIYSS